jgi:hypothetical protein
MQDTFAVPEHTHTSVPGPKGFFGYRWTIVALLFAATTINYIDRQVLGILAPTLSTEFGWSETDYPAIVSWFSPAYGFGCWSSAARWTGLVCAGAFRSPSSHGVLQPSDTPWAHRDRVLGRAGRAGSG